MTQIEIDWNRPPEVAAAIQAGMQQADDNADVRWKREIDACIRAVALRQPELTVADVREEWEKSASFTTHNLSALGPRMKKVAHELGWITATDKVKRSTIAISHGNLGRVWKSNLFNAPAVLSGNSSKQEG